MSAATAPASAAPEFRRYPKNTWRLVKLRERYLSLRFVEDQNIEGQNIYTNTRVQQSLRMKKSTDQLRNQLIENLSALDLNSNKKHTDFIVSPVAKRVDGLDQDSISPAPSLTSQSTVSPMSPNMMSGFLLQGPSVSKLDENHHHHHHQSTPLKFTQ